MNLHSYVSKNKPAKLFIARNFFERGSFVYTQMIAEPIVFGKNFITYKSNITAGIMFQKPDTHPIFKNPLDVIKTVIQSELYK